MIMQQPTSGPVPISKIAPFTGVDRGFNAAILHIAGRLFPNGFDVTTDEPRSLLELQAYHRIWNRIAVSPEYSDPELTIFGDKEVNWAFRAWHDWTHLNLGAEFDEQGEFNVACAQSKLLVNLYGLEVSQPWRRLLFAEIVGQERYLACHGQFPVNQRGFDLWYVAGGSLSRRFH